MGSGMSEWMKVLVVVLVLVGLGSGCCRECEAPEQEAPAAEAKEAVVVTPPAAAPEPPAAPPEEIPDPVLPADANAAAEPLKRHPMVSQETWDMPAGQERSRRVRLEVIEKQLSELDAQMSTSTTTLMDAEKQARTEDPEVGRLYSEMVKGRMAYREALAAHAIYAGARQQNDEARQAYRTLVQERDGLKKEITQ